MFYFQATLSSGNFLRQVSKEPLPSGGGGGGGGEGKKGGKQKKGKNRRAREREEDDKSGNWEIKFMSLSEVCNKVSYQFYISFSPHCHQISNTLLDKMEDLPDEFANNLASHLFK